MRINTRAGKERQRNEVVFCICMETSFLVHMGISTIVITRGNNWVQVRGLAWMFRGNDPETSILVYQTLSFICPIESYTTLLYHDISYTILPYPYLSLSQKILPGWYFVPQSKLSQVLCCLNSPQHRHSSRPTSDWNIRFSIENANHYSKESRLRAKWQHHYGQIPHIYIYQSQILPYDITKQWSECQLTLHKQKFNLPYLWWQKSFS